MLLAKYFSNLFQHSVKINFYSRMPKIRHLFYQKDSLQNCQSSLNVNKSYVENFEAYLPEFKKKIMKEFTTIFNDEIIATKFKEHMDYCLSFSKHYYPLMVMKLYKILQNESARYEPLEEDDLFTIGWFLELITKPFFLIDDVLDNSTHRRGIPCWHNRDSNLKILPFYVMKDIFVSLRLFDVHYGHAPFHKPICSMFYRTFVLGLIAGTISSENRILDGRAEIPGFTYNTCYIRFCPYYQSSIEIAFYLAGYETELDLEKLHKICKDLGYITLIWNDYNDVYGHMHQANKEDGRLYVDIKQGHDTWLLETAMIYSNDRQKEIIKKHYGNPNTNSVQAIVNVYDELQMGDKLRSTVEETEKRIQDQLKNFPSYMQVFIKDILRNATDWHES